MSQTKSNERPKKASGARQAQRLASNAELTSDLATGGRLVGSFFDPDGLIAIDRIVQRFGISRSQLAETVGLNRETLQRSKRVGAQRTQTRVTEMLEIIGRIAEWAGGEKQALAWYRAEPIPAFGGRTAESLVKDGKSAALRDYLDHIAVGGFA